MPLLPLLPLALLAVVLQDTTSAPSPIVRAVVGPTRTIVAGDSVRLSVQFFDAAGQRVQPLTVKWAPRAGSGEGKVTDDGLVVAGSTGKFPIAVSGLIPGRKPFVEKVDLVLVPGPAARVDIRAKPLRLLRGQVARVTAIPFSAANDRAREPVAWTSSASAVAKVDDDGIVTAVGAGKATLTATAGKARAALAVEVLGANVRSVAITPPRPRARQGDVIRFSITATDAAGKPVAGLTPTWAVAPGNGVIDADGAFVGYEPGEYLVTASLGAKTAATAVKLEPRDVRRPVSVVSRVARTAFLTSEVWIHPNGNVAYLGTHGGGDRVYAIDISNPANPVIVDSIQMNTRLVNDIMTTPDGNFLVLTREGAADRKNGIVIADTHDPLHPKAISEFTEGVTAGVHSAFVYRQEKYGTHVYLTNDGTGALHVIDINDPFHPREVAQFKTNRPDAGRYVHDIDLRDGLLYASYWNDGLVILDIGNGIKGGSPSNPVLVSQFKYDLDSLYRDDEAVTGPGFTRGTHTAWRHRNYVFIADEVYLNGPIKGAKDASADRMYGTLQVVDVSDIEHPKSVAWYTPENGGVHNVWVAGDTLYLGAYDAGFHVFDVSGELRGDLRAQGREIASLNTADMRGKVQNAAMAWGVVVNPKDGLAYVNDFHNGLWVIRVEPKLQKVVP